MIKVRKPLTYLKILRPTNNGTGLCHPGYGKSYLRGLPFQPTSSLLSVCPPLPLTATQPLRVTKHGFHVVRESSKSCGWLSLSLSPSSAAQEQEGGFLSRPEWRSDPQLHASWGLIKLTNFCPLVPTLLSPKIVLGRVGANERNSLSHLHPPPVPTNWMSQALEETTMSPAGPVGPREGSVCVCVGGMLLPCPLPLPLLRSATSHQGSPWVPLTTKPSGDHR